VIKSFKFRLYPNKETEKKLFWTLTRCRELYNAALSERKDAYQRFQRITIIVGNEHIVAATMVAPQKVKSVGFYDQSRDLPEIKYELRPEYQDIAAHVLQNVLRRLDKAFQAFFRRIANGETPGYPRFQGRDRYNSFTYPDQWGWKLEGRSLHLSKIGDIKIKLHREMQGKIKTCTIKYEAGQWYAVFMCEVEVPEKLLVSYEDIGIDLGVTHLATLSNGETIEHPRYYRKAEKKIKQLHQSLDRKKKGSHRQNKAKKTLSKAYRKTRNQRRDTLHKASKKLVDKYQVIVFEDLQEANLVKRPKPKQDENGTYLPNGASAKTGLNKSITDAGWYTFTEMVRVKAEWAGRTIIFVNPYKTSQVCSGCGTVVKKDLSERWHSCECGCELDRDHNAAINILTLGHKQLGGKRPTSATA